MNIIEQISSTKKMKQKPKYEKCVNPKEYNSRYG